MSKYAKIVEELKQQVRYEKDGICSLCDLAKISVIHFFYKKLFWPNIETFMISVPKLSQDLFAKNFRVLMYCICALKDNVKS